MFQKGMVLALILSSAGLAALWAGVQKKVKPATVVWLIIGLTIIDLWVINGEFLNLKPRRNLHQNFRKTDVVSYLSKDKGLYRIFPIDDFNTNWYGYFGLVSVGGYRAVKLRNYQDLMDAGGLNSVMVLNMLNVKYLITKRDIRLPGLKLVYSGTQKIYQNTSVLPKAWFVGEVTSVESQKESLEKILQKDFDPSQEAIVLIDGEPEMILSDGGEVVVEKYDENEISLITNAHNGGLVVLSEINYKPGWIATIDGENSPIYQTNHVLRSVYVPAGEHEVVFYF